MESETHNTIIQPIRYVRSRGVGVGVPPARVSDIGRVYEIPLGVLPGDFTLSRSQLRKNADLPVGSS